MAPTPAEISERLRELLQVDTPAAAKERESLRELCAGAGHELITYWPYAPRRMCVVCGFTEPRG